MDATKKKKFKVSEQELKNILLRKRYPAAKVVDLIRLPGKSNVLDHIDLDLTPYLKMPISLIGRSDILWLGVIGPTQSGKTVFLQAAVADTIDQAPTSSLYVMPDGSNGERAMEEKVISMIKATPEFRKHTLTPYTQTLTKKAVRLDHMTLYGASSGSLGDLSSIPYGRVFLDEVRLFKEQIKKESNAIKLAQDRLTTFRKYGMAQGYMVSTPSEEGDLLDQQRTVPDTLELWFYSKCPDCGKYQVLDFFENVKLNRKTKSVHCLCKYCQAEFDGDDKPSWTKYGKYAKLGYDGVTKLPEPKINRSRIFFRFSSLESPFRPFEMIFSEYLQTKDRMHDYKNFIQCWLAQFWQNTLSKATAADLKQTSEDKDLAKGIVPEWCKLLTAGADTQDDGWYVVIRAWGSKRRTHVVDAFFVPCKMSVASDDEVEERLREVHDATYFTTSGTEWGITLFPLDSGGHRTQELYEVAPKLPKLSLVKGRNNQQETIMYSKNVVDLYLVRTADYLEETEATMLLEAWTVFTGAEDEFYSQYVSAKKILVRNARTGNNKIEWTKTSQNDYRMADIHNYIALDIPYADGSLRRKLNNKGWSNNPLYEAKLIEQSSNDATKDDVFQSPVDAKDDFSDDFNFQF